MSDKKIIIIAIILSLILVVGGWFYTKAKPAGEGETETNSSSSETKTAGFPFGDDNAPVTIEEYTNFLCSACARFALNTLPIIEENYVQTGKVKIIFYIFPPLELGRAAFCAAQDDKFIEYHDYLFNHREEITQEKDVIDFALNVGLAEDKFNECYNSQKAKETAQGWLEEGQERGIEATPTFFINGQKLVGAKAYEEFEKIIEEKLGETTNENSESKN